MYVLNINIADVLMPQMPQICRFDLFAIAMVWLYNTENGYWGMGDYIFIFDSVSRSDYR